MQVLLDMQEQLSRDPYEALGLIPSATTSDIRNAFLTKTKQFHPARFGRMSSDVQRLANEVFLALRAAHENIARPTVKSPSPRPGGPLPSVAQRPLTGGASGTGGLRPTPAPAAPPARPANPAPAPAGAAIAQQRWGAAPPATRPGTMPARPPTQPARTVDPQPPARMPTPSPQPALRGGATPARPGTTPGPGRPGAPAATTPAAPARPGAPIDRELVPIYELFAQHQLTAARAALEAMIQRSPQSTKYRALLSYAKGREAQLDKRIDEARVELHEALQHDPDLQLAKTALAELFTRRR